MLEIRIPTNNIKEREYIVDTLLTGYLGVDYRLVVDGTVKDYVLRIGQRELVVRDVFWNRYPLPLTYLTPDALPCISSFSGSSFLFEADISVIYGKGEIIESMGGIVCGIDLFASSFFMLSRWEEYVNGVKDVHGRFPGKESVACKHDMLHRPVVNEYVELL